MTKKKRPRAITHEWRDQLLTETQDLYSVRFLGNVEMKMLEIKEGKACSKRKILLRGIALCATGAAMAFILELTKGESHGLTLLAAVLGIAGLLHILWVHYNGD